MSATLKIDDLVVCETCLSGKMFEFDFNKRCCRARHTLHLNKTMRKEKYAKLAQNHGKEYADQHISDVQRMHRLKYELDE